MESVPDPQLRHPFDHLLHHVPLAGHDKRHVGQGLEDQGGRLDKIVGSLLKRHPAEKEDRFPFPVPFAAAGPFGLRLRNGIVDDGDFPRVGAIAFGDHPLCPVAYGDDPVGPLQPCPFDRADLFVDGLAASVVFEGVDVEHQRPPADPAGQQSGGYGHPVMGVDDVEGEHAREDAAGPAVAEHLRDQVRAVNAGRFGRPLPIQGVIVARTQVGAKQGGKGTKRQTTQKRLYGRVPVRFGHGNVGGGAEVQKRGRAPLSVPGQNERDPMTESGQRFCQTVTGRTQTAAHPGRKFPAEHQDVQGHGVSPMS